MNDARPPGYLRFLRHDEYHAHFQKNHYSPLPGFMFRLTKFGLAVEVQIDSIVPRIGYGHGGSFSKKMLDEFSFADLFFVAEIYFALEKYAEFTKLLMSTPPVAEWIFNARSYCPTHRPYRPSRLDRAQALVRQIKTTQAARAALQELQK